MKFSHLSTLSFVVVASARLHFPHIAAKLIRDADDDCVATSTLPTITVTQCGGTAGASHTPVITTCPGSTIEVETTATTYVYVTKYEQFCSTGLETKTYTLTKTCDSAPCSCEPTEVPTGFTVTVATCTKCGSSPVTATLTCPTEYATTWSTAPSWETEATTVTETEACTTATVVETIDCPTCKGGKTVQTKTVVATPAVAQTTTVVETVACEICEGGKTVQTKTVVATPALTQTTTVVETVACEICEGGKTVQTKTVVKTTPAAAQTTATVVETLACETCAGGTTVHTKTTIFEATSTKALPSVHTWSTAWASGGANNGSYNGQTLTTSPSTAATGGSGGSGGSGSTTTGSTTPVVVSSSGRTVISVGVGLFLFCLGVFWM